MKKIKKKTLQNFAKRKIEKQQLTSVKGGTGTIVITEEILM